MRKGGIAGEVSILPPSSNLIYETPGLSLEC